MGLVPAPGGFRTPPFGANRRFRAVDGTELVVGDAAGTRRTALTTIRTAAAVAPFGVIRTSKQIGTVPEAVAFFRNARARVHTAPASPSGRMP